MPITWTRKSWQQLTESGAGLSKEWILPFTQEGSARSKLISIEELLPKDREEYLSHPKKLIIDAARMNREIGSSTLVIVTLDPKTSKLNASMIGDSGYLIIRQESQETQPQESATSTKPAFNNLKVLYKSEEQQHSFNFPFQIGSQGDNPSKSVSFQHDIQPNDIVIVGTDGLLDNLFADNILSIVKEHLNTQSFDSNMLAQQLAKNTFQKSLDTKWDSPFAVSARKSGLYFKGGKSDDITVLVGRVESSE